MIGPLTSDQNPINSLMLMQVLERTINAVIIADVQGRITWTNAGFERITGYRSEEVIGKSPGKLLQGPKTDPEVDERMRLAVRNKTSFDETILNYKKTGEPYWNHIECQPLMDNDKHWGFLAIETDVTETINYQNQLIEANNRAAENMERLLLACAGGQVGSWEWNPRTDKLHFHESWERLVGKPIAALDQNLGTWLDRIHPSELDDIVQQFTQISAGTLNQIVSEHRLLCHNNSYRWTMARGQVVQWDQQGRPTRVVGVHLDISEQKSNQRLLNQQNNLLRTILDVIPFSVCWKDENLRFLGCNKQFAETSGFADPQEIIGKTVTDLGWNCPASLAEQEVERTVIQTKIPVLHQVEQQTIRCNEKMIVDTSKAPLELHDGTTGILAIYIDITELEMARENLSRKELELRHRGRMEAVGELAGGVAHEFNNLLQAIRGYVSFARDDVSPESTTFEDLSESLKTIDRAVELTGQLLRFSRPEEIEKRASDPHGIVRDLQILIRPLLPKNINVVYQLHEALPQIYCNPVTLVQVMLNLCVNARDAMPTGGTLTLGTGLVKDESQRDVVTFSVQDTGHGIPESIRERIFDPFFTTKEIGAGTGLGLSMVYSTVKEHEGNIEIETEEGTGTRFTIRIPAAIHQSPQQALDSQPNFYPWTNGTESTIIPTILLAEDEPAVMRVSKRMLENLGFYVVTAQNGREAVALFREYQDSVDGLVFDVMMPQMAGTEAYDEIRKKNPDLPVIFCSGYDFDLTQELISKSDRFQIVTKPFDQFALQNALFEVGLLPIE